MIFWLPLQRDVSVTFPQPVVYGDENFTANVALSCLYWQSATVRKRELYRPSKQNPGTGCQGHCQCTPNNYPSGGRQHGTSSDPCGRNPRSGREISELPETLHIRAVRGNKRTIDNGIFRARPRRTPRGRKKTANLFCVLGDLYGKILL